MKITPKSPERIASQAAEFAHAKLEGDQKQNILQHAARIATSEFVVPEPSASRNAYLDFLRKGREQLREDIDFFEEKLQAYSMYEAEISRLLDEVAQLEDPRSHPQYLGAGNNAKAFWFDHDSKRYVARIPHNPESLAAHEHMRAFARGNKIANLQKLAAASPEGRVIVTELLPGKNANELTLEDRREISDKNIRDAIRLFIEMNEAGLGFDPKVENVMYDKEVGFTILDYQRKEDDDGANVPKDIMYFSYIVAPGISRDPPDPENIVEQKTVLRERFYRVLEQTAPELVEAVRREQAERDTLFSEIPTIEELGTMFAEPADDFYEVNHTN